MFTVIHTADWQLGHGFDRFPPDPAAALRRARLDAIARIGRVATEAGAGAVLAAGDCFDHLAVADETLRRFLAATESFAGTWVLLPGNHDPALAESPWSRLRRIGLPGNVVIADRPEPIALGPATVLPAPLRRRHDAQDLTAWFDEAPSDGFRIGLAHGQVTDRLPAEAEATNPIAPDRAARARLDYLALGDWHGTFRIDERTWYSGTPEPDRFRDNDAGNVLKVTLAPGRPPAVEKLRTARLAWHRLAVELTPGGVHGLGQRLAGLAGDSVLRLALTGVVDLATRGAALDAVAEAAARVVDLNLDETGLALEPSEDDLDAIDRAGFVRAALDELRALDGPDAPRARRAIAHLHRLHLDLVDEPC